MSECTTAESASQSTSAAPGRRAPAGENREHRHFGYWINRELYTARCYECGFQFAGDDDTAEEWDGSGEWEGESRLTTELLAADPNTKTDDTIRVTLGNGAEIMVAAWRGCDGVPVVQIDTDRTGRVRINLNDAPVWEGPVGIGVENTSGCPRAHGARSVRVFGGVLRWCWRCL